MRRRSQSVFILILLIFGLSFFIYAQAPKRLILKDGTYQSVVKYEINGDRVRYLSAERYEWEEIPKSLVDWEATDKYEKDRITGNVSSGIKAVDEEAAKEKAEQEALSPTVSPGIRLPATGGVFLLDVYQGQPHLSEIDQNGGEINKNMTGNILRATINPLAKNKQTIELKDLHARIQSHVGDPFLYVNIAGDEPGFSYRPEDLKKRYRIVRAEPKKGVRVVGTISTAIYGKSKQEQKLVEASAEAVSGGPWVKITPAENLKPGEYALVEMLDSGMNLFVWDFGVNPSAPENPGAWKPEPTKSNHPADTKEPALDSRKK